MKAQRHWLLSMLALMITASAHALPKAAAVSPEQVIVNYLSTAVHPLKTPVYVWSWFGSQGRDSVWTSPISADSEAGYLHVLNGTKQFLEGYCSQDASLNPPDCPPPAVITSDLQYSSSDEYGPGLYAAVDPVSTMIFGQSSSWVLLQVQLPQGFRLLNIPSLNNFSDANLQNALRSVGCESSAINSATTADVLFQLSSGQASNIGPVPPKCLVEMRKIFKDKLKLNGFIYGYGGAEFKECDASNPALVGSMTTSLGNASLNPLRNVALVLMNPGLIRASDVKVFNSQTTDGVEDRQRIQSLFYEADIGEPAVDAFMYYYNLEKKTPIAEFQGKFLSMAQLSCGGTSGNSSLTCPLSLSLCDSSNVSSCDSSASPPTSVPPPKYPTSMPSMMQNSNPPNTQTSVFIVYTVMTGGTPLPNPLLNELIWPDLDGKAPTPNLSNWMKQNLLGCSENYPF